VYTFQFILEIPFLAAAGLNHDRGTYTPTVSSGRALHAGPFRAADGFS